MAIGSQIGSLYVRIGADTGDLDKGMKKAGLAIKNFAGVAKAATLAMVAVGTAVTAAAATFVAFTRSAATSANELANLARVANTGVESFQKWSYAARTVGIEQDKLADILKDVNDRVGEFMQTGGGPMKDFFTQIAPKIGITANAFRNLSGPQALQLYYDSLVKAGASQQDLTFYMEAMASDSTRLLPLLKDSGEAFKELGDQAARTGIIMSQLDVAKLQDAFAQFQKLGAVFEAIKNQIAIALAPVVSELLDRFTDGSIDVRTFGEYAVKAFRLVATAVAHVIDAVNDFRRDLKGLQVMGDFVNMKLVEGFNWINKELTALINSFISNINKVIAVANMAPKINIPLIAEIRGDTDFSKNLESMVQAAKAQLAKSQGEFKGLSETGSAVDGVNKLFDDAKARGENAANALDQYFNNGGQGGNPSGLSNPSLGSSGASDSRQKEHEAYIQQLNQRLEALREFTASETELEVKAHLDRMAQLNDLYEQGLVSDEERRELQLDLEAQHQEAITGIQKRELEERKRAVEQAANAEMSMRRAVVQNAIGLMDQLAGKSKAAAIAGIALSKALQLAQLAQTTQTAAMLAFASQLIPGDPSSFARAAAAKASVQAMGAISAGIIAATGLAQAAGALRSNSGLSGGASSSIGGQSSAPSPQPVQSVSNQIVTISLEGDVFSRKGVRDLIGKINDAVSDGARIQIT